MMPRLPNGHFIDNFYVFKQTILVFKTLTESKLLKLGFTQVRELFSRNVCAFCAKYALTDLEVSAPMSMIKTLNIRSEGLMSS